MDTEHHSFSTLALHTKPPEESWAGGHQRHLAPPITVSATFELPTGEEIQGEPVYGRYGHPSRCHLEQSLASLECSSNCLVFSSGMAAAHALLQTLTPGDHIVAGISLYGGVLNLIRQMRDVGVLVTFVSTSNSENISSAVKPSTKLIWLEVCSNPSLQLLDIKNTVVGIRKVNPKVKVAVDNTFLTSWVCKPLEFGVDIVMHSVTKYINGHSDVIMGALLTNDTLLHDQLYKIQKYRGATPSAFDCFLVLRSLATLELRMQQHMKSGLEVATFLSSHPAVTNVIHPLLPHHPQHQTALDQHQGRHSGMVAFELSSTKAAQKFISLLKVVKGAASLGSSHSLICQPAKLTHVMCTKEERDEAGVTDGLLRLSVGLENVEDLIDDIKNALEKCNLV